MNILILFLLIVPAIFLHNILTYSIYKDIENKKRGEQK